MANERGAMGRRTGEKEEGDLLLSLLSFRGNGERRRTRQTGRTKKESNTLRGKPCQGDSLWFALVSVVPSPFQFRSPFVAPSLSRGRAPSPSVQFRCCCSRRLCMYGPRPRPFLLLVRRSCDRSKGPPNHDTLRSTDLIRSIRFPQRINQSIEAGPARLGNTRRDGAFPHPATKTVLRSN